MGFLGKKMKPDTVEASERPSFHLLHFWVHFRHIGVIWCPKFPSLTQLSGQYLFPFVGTCLFIINQKIAGCKCSPCLNLAADSWFFMVLRLHSDGFFRTSCIELSKTNPARGLLQTSADFQRTRLVYGPSKFRVLDTCTIALLQPCKCDSIEITIDYWTSVLIDVQRRWLGD